MEIAGEVLHAALEHERRTEADLMRRYGSLKPAAAGLMARRNSRKCFDSADYAMTLSARASGELPPDACLWGGGGDALAALASPPAPHPGVLGGRGPAAPTRASTSG